MYVYRRSNEPEGPLFTVGFYSPTGDWNPESDHDDQVAAANRVHWLNGGKKEEDQKPYEMSKRELVSFLESIRDGLKEEQKNAPPSFDPDFKILKDVFIEMVDTLRVDYLRTFDRNYKENLFEDAIELNLNHREIQLDIDNSQIAETCFQIIESHLPTVKTFVDVFREKCIASWVE